jgi:hypothetical protein
MINTAVFSLQDFKFIHEKYNKIGLSYLLCLHCTLNVFKYNETNLLSRCWSQVWFWVLGHRLKQCFSNWISRNPRGPRRDVRGSERRKRIIAEEFYWLPEICMYELKFVWRYSTLIILSLRTVVIGIHFKQRRHSVYKFGFLGLIVIKIVYFLKC